MLELDEHCAQELVPAPLPLQERFVLEAIFHTYNGAAPERSRIKRDENAHSYPTVVIGEKAKS